MTSLKRSLLTELKDDYTRHGARMTNPEFWVIAVYRYGHHTMGVGGIAGRLASKVYGALNLGILLTTGCTIHREAEIGDGLHIIHTGNIRIHPDAKLGERVGIMQDVTIGTNMGRPGTPVIGNDVFIGAGAKILGKVVIGDGARIAANSLVLNDVPAGATAVGVPARVMRYTGRKGPAAETPKAAVAAVQDEAGAKDASPEAGTNASAG